MSIIRHLCMVMAFLACYSLPAGAQLSMEDIKTLELGKSFDAVEEWLANQLGDNISSFKGNVEHVYKIESPVVDSVWVIKKHRPAFDSYGDCKYIFKFASEKLIGVDIRFQFIGLDSERDRFEALLKTMMNNFSADKDFMPLKTADEGAADLEKIVAHVRNSCPSEAENENFSRKPSLLLTRAWEVHKRVHNDPRHKLLTLQVHTAPVTGQYYSGCTAIVELSVSNEQFINIYNQISQSRIQYELLEDE